MQTMPYSLQKMKIIYKELYLFKLTAKSLNMEISSTKTKYLTTSKTSLRCKLELDYLKFNYLGIKLFGFGEIEAEVRDQTTKTIRIASCLNTIWCNKSMGTDTKSRIYKTVVSPVM